VNVGELLATLKLDGSDFSKGIDSAEHKTKSLIEKMGTTGKVIQGIGKTAQIGFGAFGVGAATAVGGVVAVGAALTKFASDASAIPGIQGAF